MSGAHTDSDQWCGKVQVKLQFGDLRTVAV